MGKNIVTMIIALFAVLAVLGIIYAVNNVNPNAPRPFEDVLLPEGEDVWSPIAGEEDVLVVPPEFMPGVNTVPGRTTAPEESRENLEFIDEADSLDIDGQNSAGEQAGDENEAVVCTLDAKMCPDGSFVGRIAPNCDFAPCLEE